MAERTEKKLIYSEKSWIDLGMKQQRVNIRPRNLYLLSEITIFFLASFDKGQNKDQGSL